jgi:hypothetical protein
VTLVRGAPAVAARVAAPINAIIAFFIMIPRLDLFEFIHLTKIYKKTPYP